MPSASKTEQVRAAELRESGPFTVLGTDPAGRVLRGAGDPAFEVVGHRGREIFVEILDSATGRTWFGRTRDWTYKDGAWHWSLDLALATDTADTGAGFDDEAGAVDILAYFEEVDPETGRLSTHQAEAIDLTVAQPRKANAPTDSVSAVLARIREMGEGRPTRGRLAPQSAMCHLPEDRFVFIRRAPRPFSP